MAFEDQVQRANIEQDNRLKKLEKENEDLKTTVGKLEISVQNNNYAINALSNTVNHLIKAKEELTEVVEEMNIERTPSFVSRWKRKLKLGRIK